MKNLITTFVLLITISATLTAQDMTATEATADLGVTALTVQLTGLKSDKGQLMVALYDSSDNWLGNGIMGEITTIVDGQATVTFNDVPYGTYAISSFHDKDSNGELNTGLFGIPKEPYASSRGARGRFGPPKWADAKFVLENESAEEIIKF